MSYCDDCILLDICGKEGSCDEAMTFCADKHEFIHISTLDKIRAEINKARFIDKYTRLCKNTLASGLEVALQIIDKYKAESEDK